MKRLLATISCITVGIVLALAGCGGSGSPADQSLKVFKNVSLSGAQVVPAVTSAATGSGLIGLDTGSGAVSGSITTFGLSGTTAHLHTGAVGANGAAMVELTQSSPGTWSVVDGAKLTSDQMDAFRNGASYVEIATSANPDGEIRGQVCRLVYFATLFGAQESPPTASTATGTGVYVFDPETKTLSGSTTSTVNGIPSFAELS